MNFRLIAAVSMALGTLAGCGSNSGDSSSNNGTNAASLTAPTTQAAPATRQVESGSSRGVVAGQLATLLAGKYADFSFARANGQLVVTHKVSGERTVVADSVQRIYFDDLTVEPKATSGAAIMYRLYQAAFDRVPDAEGLGFWTSAYNGAGVAIDHIAGQFVDSPEYKTRYGTLNNAQFLTQLYQNILHRAPDQEGYKFWLAPLEAGSISRAHLLAQFSESPENVAGVAAAIANGVAYKPYIVPGAGSVARAGVTTIPLVYWNASASTQLALYDNRGTAVPGASLSCTALDPAVLTISSDCRTASAKRLGLHEIIISGGGVSAHANVKAVPQRIALGSTGNTRHFNVVTTADDYVLGWGYNSGGQLGQGKSLTGDGLVPVAVRNTDNSGLLQDMVAASAGELTTMGLTRDGQVLAWGPGDQLARPVNSGSLPNFVRNPANNGPLSGIVQIGVGDGNAVALTDDGRVFTWGNYAGQGTSDRSNYPSQPKSPDGKGVLTNIVQVAAGWNFSLALSADGKVYGWGWNSGGQTGRGTVGNPEVLPAAVRRAADNLELDNIVAISAGYNFAVALSADGKVYIWGDNDFGQVGQGSDDVDAFPKAVLLKGPGGTAPLENIAMVSAGGIHGLALDKAGRVYSWGHNNDGELGDGVAVRTGVRYWAGPVVNTDGLGQLDNIVSIAAGYEGNLALRKDGTVLVWGNGFGGFLGQNSTSTADLFVPTAVKGLGGVGTLTLDLSAYPNLLRRGR